MLGNAYVLRGLNEYESVFILPILISVLASYSSDFLTKSSTSQALTALRSYGICYGSSAIALHFARQNIMSRLEHIATKPRGTAIGKFDSTSSSTYFLKQLHLSFTIEF